MLQCKDRADRKLELAGKSAVPERPFSVAHDLLWPDESDLGVELPSMVR